MVGALSQHRVCGVKIKEDPDKSNGKVLQSLMTQVSTLESTFGDKVSKLEASLKLMLTT